MYMQKVDNIADLIWTMRGSDIVTYGDLFTQNELEHSTYNFETADTKMLFQHFNDWESECKKSLEKGLPLVAYEMVLKSSHIFNILDARHAISVTERQGYILRVRNLARSVAQVYYEKREKLGFPLLRKETKNAK